MGGKPSKQTVTATLTKTSTLSTYTQVLLYTETHWTTHTVHQTTTFIQPTTIRATETKIVTTPSPNPGWYDDAVLKVWLAAYVMFLVLLGAGIMAFIMGCFAGRSDEKEPLLRPGTPPRNYGAPPRYSGTTPRGILRNGNNTNGGGSSVLPQYTP